MVDCAGADGFVFALRSLPLIMIDLRQILCEDLEMYPVPLPLGLVLGTISLRVVRVCLSCVYFVMRFFTLINVRTDFVS